MYTSLAIFKIEYRWSPLGILWFRRIMLKMQIIEMTGVIWNTFEPSFPISSVFVNSLKHRATWSIICVRPSLAWRNGRSPRVLKHPQIVANKKAETFSGHREHGFRVFLSSHFKKTPPMAQNESLSLDYVLG